METREAVKTGFGFKGKKLKTCLQKNLTCLYDEKEIKLDAF